jgi:ureidoacrylate peracid hydrolase
VAQSLDLATLVHPRQTAVLVVDIQNDFCSPHDAPEAARMLPRLRELVAQARRAGAQLVFTKGINSDSAASEVWLSRPTVRVHGRQPCRPDTPGADYHPDFRPQAGDLEIVKYRYSAFLGTSLELRLRALGIRTVVMTGIATNVCVESTARDAFQHDFYVVMLEDCMETNSDMLQQATLETMRRHFGLVARSDEVIAAWQAVAAPV